MNRSGHRVVVRRFTNGMTAGHGPKGWLRPGTHWADEATSYAKPHRRTNYLELTFSTLVSGGESAVVSLYECARGYLVLDEYSRKALAWRISWVQTSAEAGQLLETALIQENVLDLPEDAGRKSSTTAADK